MGLEEKIDEGMREALRAGDKLRLSTIRMLRAAIHNRAIEKKRKLTDEEITQVISSLIKKAKESIEQFQKGNRIDLVEKEEAEMNVLLSFMPQQLGKDEIEKIVDQKIMELNAKDLKDLGAVMKATMALLKGKADGKMVNEIVRMKLSH
jgi:uncharacterized protein YqeY